MNDCLFCKIIAGDIPSKKVYEDDAVYAFHDIAPMAPVHVLVVPKCHIACADEITEANADAVARIFTAIPKIAASPLPHPRRQEAAGENGLNQHVGAPVCSGAPMLFPRSLSTR